MIRTPLRPLARILSARAKGENPDAIERENLRLRHEEMRDSARLKAEGRLLLLGLAFVAGFGTVGLRMGVLASTAPEEPKSGQAGPAIVAQRADITDREGRILATNLVTHALYAQPKLMVDPAGAAEKLALIFPDLDAEKLRKDFTGSKKFLWIKKRISPEQMQLVHEIGDPGLLFGPREMRLYPNGALASHILGGSSFGREGVASAEVIGTAGIEKTFDQWLRDPANGGAPLQLSIDLSVQATVEEVLDGGMKLMNAKGAAAILMDVRTGEVIAMASLPDFDPNTRPAPLVKGQAGDSPLFNRAVQGVYELGSTFKIFAVAQALDLGLVNPMTMVDTKSPMFWGKYKIRDFHNYGAQNTVTDVVVKSSNVGTAHIIGMVGAEKQQAFLKSLGFFEPTPVELVEAPTGKPLIPKKWSEISMLTISYGHGLSASPLHLASAYASIVNGGTRVRPTILKTDKVQEGERVISEKTSEIARSLLRQVVVRGTASFGEVPGYAVGGKTGTADKPKPTGGYYDDKVVTTFASTFPSYDPKYVLIVTLDEPVESSGDEPRRTAGWTSVPVAAEMIRRVAPLLGLRPEVEPGLEAGVTRVSSN
ncbi:penicillin-binding protein 2 [Frigidibacter sp. SD6-1]|uniref:peptidoglycan D,D-transpeptidase FtsI family protein n=1 Tax=Frigidibacter sp. SD6-1 TaxID=3032581 RepID=UPI0024DF71CF|nr:penicillin-binding protein 2 [Frigidibacter sp. SD6-1]